MKINRQKLIFIVMTLTCTSVHAGGCTGNGDVILDNTETPGVVAIGGNLGFTECGDMSSTAIKDGYGGNAINISDFEVITRKINASSSPDELQLFIGKQTATVSEFKFDTDEQLNYFADGSHLFDLDRLRAAADWITDNAKPDTGIEAGTYGTISMEQFLGNIASGTTMYGMVRVLVPLEKGASNSTLNALEETVAQGSIYGFCTDAKHLCSCSPGESFKEIKGGVTACGHTLPGDVKNRKPGDAKIKVKGGLFWDFVDSVDGHSLELAELPFVPRDLYFKVILPVMVNWAHDLDDDGAMDNASLVYSYSDGEIDQAIVKPTFLFADVPLESKAQYQFDTGVALTEALFDALDPATKYHTMLPSGYADGWAEAFDKLNITLEDWSTIPGMSKPFRVPNHVTGVMTADDVRSEGFEDIPTYLYSGGLIDMHDHVNVSGLVYVPQGMELEAKLEDVRQYVSGAIIVRDTFYIEAKSGSVTIVSSDPSSYSAVRIAPPTDGSGSGSGSRGELTFLNRAFEEGANGDSSSDGNENAGSESTGTAGNVRWQEVRPQL